MSGLLFDSRVGIEAGVGAAAGAETGVETGVKCCVCWRLGERNLDLSNGSAVDGLFTGVVAGVGLETGTFVVLS